MHILRLSTTALALGSAQAAVLPRQEATTSSLTSLPNTSATKKSFLTSITSLPLPSSVDGNTAYPPTTTESVSISTQVFTPASTTSSRPPFTWNWNGPQDATTTASSANATSATGSAFGTGLSSSSGNVTTSGGNSTVSSSLAPFTNSTMGTAHATGVGVAATGTAVVVTGISAANATAQSSVRYANSTTAAQPSSTSMLVQMYLAKPTTALNNNETSTVKSETSMLVQMYLAKPTAAANNKEASTTEIDLGSNMTLVVSDEPATGSAEATIAPFANSTSASGVTQATGTGVLTSSSALPAASSDASGFSTRTKDRKAPLSTGTSGNNATSSSSVPLSTGTSSSSAPVANAVDNNGTMFAVTFDNKNNTIVHLMPASNSTNPLGASGTAPAAGSTGTASAGLGRRDVPAPTAAPITPASQDKKSWSNGFPGFAYSRTESLTRPSRFFSGDGWSWTRRS